MSSVDPWAAPAGRRPSTEDRARALQYIGRSPGRGAGGPERTKAPAKMSAPAGEGRPLPNSHWVVPGRFAAGEYPGAKDPDETAAKLRALLSAGIDHFIDLTEPGEGLAPVCRDRGGGSRPPRRTRRA